MSLNPFAWAAVVSYVLVVLIALWRARSGATFTLFSIGPRRASPVFVGLSVAAASASSATFVTNPGLLYQFGWSGFLAIYVWSTLGFLVGLALFSFRFRQTSDSTNALTVPQWLAHRYKSPNLGLLFSLICLLETAYLVLVCVGVASVLSATLGISDLLAISLIVCFTFGSILMGGAGSHLMTTSVQGVVMLACAALLLGSGAHLWSDGWTGFAAALEGVGPFFEANANPDSQLYRNAFEIGVAQFAIGVASALLPHLLNKALFLRRKEDTRTYLATASVAILVFKAVLLVGLYARIQHHAAGTEPIAADRVMASYLVETFSQPVQAFIVLGILAAGLSTMEGILLSLASIFANDLYAVAAQRMKWQPNSLRASRVFIAVLIPITIFIAWDQLANARLSVIIFAFNGIFGVTTASFAPLLIGIWTNRSLPASAALAGAIAGVASFYAITAFGLVPLADNPMVPATWAMAASLIVFGVAVAISPRSTPDFDPS